MRSAGGLTLIQDTATPLGWLSTVAGLRLTTERLTLRPPARGDFTPWSALRRSSQDFLKPWEPAWSSDHLSAASFRRRVGWARREIVAGRAYPFLIFAPQEPMAAEHRGLVGGLTLEHVRRGAAMSGALGYWLGQPYVNNGFMSEAIMALAAFAFNDLDLSRLEAACLPENFASRRVLERCGFTQESLAVNYLQIDGAWRDHLIYERRRPDRR